MGSFPGEVLITNVGKFHSIAGGLVPGVGVLVRVRIEAVQVVVTLDTIAGFQFEHVHKLRVEPRLLADEPGGTEGTEVTPLVTLRKAGRSVATIAAGNKDFAVVVVLGAGQETLGDIAVGIRAGAHAGTGTVRVVQFAHIRVEEVIVAAAQVLGHVAVIFITGQEVQVVDVGNVKLVLGQVLLVHGEHAAVAYVHITVCSGGTGELAAQGA